MSDDRDRCPRVRGTAEYGGRVRSAFERQSPRQGVGPVRGLARISHTIFARSSKVERGFVSFCGDVLARGVGRRERELGFFRSCGCSEQFDLSVGLG